jgi:hypothetical protein
MMTLDFLSKLGIALVSLGSAALAADELNTMTFHVLIVEAHDRVLPTPVRAIVYRHEVDVIFKPNKEIDETEHYTQPNDNRGFDFTAHRTSTLGSANNRMVWHVLGPNKLQRLISEPASQMLSIWTIETDANHGCRIDAKWLLQEGKTDTAGTIGNTTQPASFNNFRLLRASCTME